MTVLAIAAGLALVVAITRWRLERKRRERLAAVAAELGFTVVERDDTLLDRFSDYGRPFDRDAAADRAEQRGQVDVPLRTG
jgi:hypothetical protein